LLQRQTASLEADVHEPGPREVGVSEYRDHQNGSTATTLLPLGNRMVFVCLPLFSETYGPISVSVNYLEIARSAYRR
jgi:hypothetical protein